MCEPSEPYHICLSKCDQSAKRASSSGSQVTAFDALNPSMSFFDGALMSFGLGLISAS